MARRKAADHSTERGERRAETNAVSAYLTALRAPKVPARNRAKLVQRRTQIEQWLSEGDLSPIEELWHVQRRLDIDADLGSTGRPTPRARGSAREGRRLVVQAQRDHRGGTTRGRRASPRARQGAGL